MTTWHLEINDAVHKRSRSSHLHQVQSIIHIVYIQESSKSILIARPLSALKMVKIALLGAAGQIGTPLSLLCKAVCPPNKLTLEVITPEAKCLTNGRVIYLTKSHSMILFMYPALPPI